MIEAMARGLPCIGSSVGGIPELLPSQDMVPAGDIEALAEKIAEVVSAPQRLARMSRRNLARASDYRETVLSGRRKEFYDYVERCTRVVEITCGIGDLSAADEGKKRNHRSTGQG